MAIAASDLPYDTFAPASGRPTASFQDLKCPPSNDRVFECATLIGYPARRIPFRNHQLLGVTVNYEISVIGDEDHLPILLRFSDRLDQLLHDEFVIQVIIMGVDDDRFLSLRQINLDQYRAGVV